MRRLGRVGVRQWPRARFRRAALASVAVCPHGQGVSVPGPACNATRLGSEASSIPGGFPGRRVATRIRAAAASPFGLSEPASGSEWPVVPWRGVCPRDIAISAIAAPDCAFRRPRRLQPTTLPVAALWMAASYHRVTRASLGKFLSRSLPPLARRPILAPVTTRFALIRTRNACRAVTGGNRAKPGREPSQLAQTPVDHATPSPPVRLRRYAHDPLSPLPVPVCQTCSRVKGGPPQHPPGGLRP